MTHFRDTAIAAAAEEATGLTNDELDQAIHKIRDHLHQTRRHLALTGLALAIRERNDNHANYWLSSLQATENVSDWFSGANPDPPTHLLPTHAQP